MNEQEDIDSRIDAALAARVRAPRLDRQFDAAVWRRIESAAQQPAPPASASARVDGRVRWLRAGNAVAVAVAVGLTGYYGWELAAGNAPDWLAGLAMEAGSPGMTPAAWVITICALAFGLRYTALGRWWGSVFS